MVYRKIDVESLLVELESKIARYVKETVVDEREDLKQDLKILIIEKTNNWQEEPIRFINFAKEIQLIE